MSQVFIVFKRYTYEPESPVVYAYSLEEAFHMQHQLAREYPGTSWAIAEVLDENSWMVRVLRYMWNIK